MGKRHGMYIDYERSYKRRNHKDKSKFWHVIWIIVIVAGLGLAAYLVISGKVIANQNKNNTYKHVVTIVPTATPTPGPTPKPSSQPVKTVASDNVSDISSEEEGTITPTVVKGIYVPVSAAGSDTINKLIKIADTTEINAMVIDVKDDYGKISYPMDCALAKEIGATTDKIEDMEALVRALKDKHIYLIARVVAFKDPYLAEQRQDLAIKNKDGSMYRDNNGEGWVNPYNQEVWNYLVDIASQAAAVGFDEIQFDYIRFSTGDGIDDADFGEEAKNKSKESIITEFTKYAYETLKPLGLNVSADVYGTIISSSIDAGLVGQNYVEMSKYLDYISPMIYPSHFGKGNYGVVYPDLEPYNIIRKALAASKAKLDQIPEGEHHAVVRPWLQDFTAKWVKPHMEYGGPELRQQIDGVYSVGYGEWLLWNNSCEYSVDGLVKE